MTYEHYIYTTEADSLAAAYQREGFITEVRPAPLETLVMVYADYDDAIREKVERIAEEHGATYDGGGMYVGPLGGLA